MFFKKKVATKQEPDNSSRFRKQTKSIFIPEGQLKHMSDDERQDSDFDWFVENHKALYDIYGEAYLAIKNHLVIGVYKSFAEGVNETEKYEREGSFIVQYNNGTPSGYTTFIGAM